MIRLLEKDREIKVGELLDPRVLVWNPCAEIFSERYTFNLVVIPEWSRDLKLLDEGVRSINFAFKILPFPKLNLIYFLLRIGNLSWVGAPYSPFASRDDMGFGKPPVSQYADGYVFQLSVVCAPTGRVVRNELLRLPRPISLEILRLALEQEKRAGWNGSGKSKPVFSTSQFQALCQKAELEYSGGGFDMMAADAPYSCNLDARFFVRV
jgi:hypothetical protein